MTFSRRILRTALACVFAGAAATAGAQPVLAEQGMAKPTALAQAKDQGDAQKKKVVAGYVAGFLESSPMKVIIALEEPFAGRNRIEVSETMFSKADRENLRSDKRVDLEVQLVERDGQQQVKV